MTEVTPILENTRFSSIFEYNRFMTPLLCAAGGFAFLYGLELVLPQLFGNFLPGGGGGQSGL